MRDGMNILTTELVAPHAGQASKACDAGDVAALSAMVVSVYAEMRDDLSLHPAPAWLHEARGVRDMVTGVCKSIAAEMARQAGIDTQDALTLDEASRHAIDRIEAAMDEADADQMQRTRSVMVDHDRRRKAIQGRLLDHATMGAMSPWMKTGIIACVIDRLDDYATMLVLDDGIRRDDLGAGLLRAVLRACDPSRLTVEDMAVLAVDDRLDRRAVEVASSLLELCMDAAAHALETSRANGTRASYLRIAATALGADPTMEIRLKARMLVLGQIARRSGK